MNKLKEKLSTKESKKQEAVTLIAFPLMANSGLNEAQKDALQKAKGLLE